MELIFTNLVGDVKVMQGVIPIDGRSCYVMITINYNTNDIIDVRSHYLNEKGQIVDIDIESHKIKKSIHNAFMV